LKFKTIFFSSRIRRGARGNLSKHGATRHPIQHASGVTYAEPRARKVEDLPSPWVSVARCAKPCKGDINFGDASHRFFPVCWIPTFVGMTAFLTFFGYECGSILRTRFYFALSGLHPFINHPSQGGASPFGNRFPWAPLIPRLWRFPSRFAIRTRSCLRFAGSTKSFSKKHAIIQSVAYDATAKVAATKPSMFS
jgi:hypothetical protein